MGWEQQRRRRPTGIGVHGVAEGRARLEQTQRAARRAPAA
jgi:hypothetical protein